MAPVERSKCEKENNEIFDLWVLHALTFLLPVVCNNTTHAVIKLFIFVSPEALY